MDRSKAADALRAALTNQFGKSARGIINAEVDARLSGRQALSREDLDTIEKNILGALRRGRQSRPPDGAAGWERAMGASASTPAFSQTAPNFWAGDIHTHQTRTGPTSPQSNAALPPSTRAVSSTNSASAAKGASSPLAGAADMRSTLRRTAQLQPRLKPKDPYDLMLEFGDEDFQKSEQQRKQARKLQLASFRRGLDVQLEEQSQARQREDVDRQRTREAVLRQVDENLQREHAAALKKSANTEKTKKNMEEEMEGVAAKKERGQKQLQKEAENLDRTLVMEREASQRKANEKHSLHAQRATELRERFLKAETDRKNKKLAEAEAAAKLAEDFKRRCDERAEEANKGYKIRQARVDHFSKLAIPRFEAESQRGKAEEDRVEKNYQEQIKKDNEDQKRRLEAIDQKNRTIKASQTSQVEVRKTIRGKDEREISMQQSMMWKQADEEHFANVRQKAEQKKEMRDSMDSVLCERMHTDKNIHRMDAGVPEISGKELAYHRTFISSMAEKGFRPDVSATLVAQASPIRAGGPGLQ